MVGMGVSRRALLANKSRKKRRSSFAHWCLFASLLVLCCWCSSSFFCYNFQQFPEESVIEPSTTRRTMYYLTSMLDVLRRLLLVSMVHYMATFLSWKVRCEKEVAAVDTATNLSFHKSCHNSFSICSVTPQYFDTNETGEARGGENHQQKVAKYSWYGFNTISFTSLRRGAWSRDVGH